MFHTDLISLLNSYYIDFKSLNRIVPYHHEWTNIAHVSYRQPCIVMRIVSLFKCIVTPLIVGASMRSYNCHYPVLHYYIMGTEVWVMTERIRSPIQAEEMSSQDGWPLGMGWEVYSPERD